MQVSFFIDFSISVLTSIPCAPQKMSLGSFLLSLLGVLESIYKGLSVYEHKNIECVVINSGKKV